MCNNGSVASSNKIDQLTARSSYMNPELLGDGRQSLGSLLAAIVQFLFLGK